MTPEEEQNHYAIMQHSLCCKNLGISEAFDEEAFRFMTVDKQRDHFWVVIRAWRSNGSSRLLYFGRIETFDQIDELRGKMKVEPSFLKNQS